MFDLNGKRALVTGSTQGIGFAIAKALSEHGAKVFVHGGTSYEKCENAAKKISGSVPVCVDLSDTKATKMLYEKTGDVDILVLNASIQYRTPWDEIGTEEFSSQVQVNLKSVLDAMQIYSESMKKNRWGRIVVVGSVQQHKPHKDMAIYAATKCAIMSLVENIGKQLAPFGVTVNNLNPGVIATPRNDKALSDDEYRKKVLEGIPMGYAGEPEDMTAAALLLCSDEGRYITGSEINVDGGMRL